jgi:heme-degrading monooxygenase HmoA
MYARLLKFNTDPSRRSEVEAVADRAFAAAKQQQGFISIHFIISTDESEYGSFSLWESMDDAETGGAAIRSQLEETLQDLATAPPTIDVYEIYKPSA